MLNKLKSIKNLLVIWAVVLISFIVFANRQEFIQLATVLSGAVIVYFPVNVQQKKILKGEDKNDN